MKLKMLNIINFNIFYEEIKTNKLPFKMAYKLSNLTKAIETNLQFYQEKIQEILREYGELDENGDLVPTDDGKGVKVKPGTEIACMTEINELQNVEIELPDIKFTIEEFDNIELPLEVFQIIMPFIQD
jgi:hypothetical protein